MKRSPEEDKTNIDVKGFCLKEELVGVPVAPQLRALCVSLPSCEPPLLVEVTRVRHSTWRAEGRVVVIPSVLLISGSPPPPPSSVITDCFRA